MNILLDILNNLLQPAILFFLLGILAVHFKSDLEFPPQIGKFLSIYLLFCIGLLGGYEISHSGIDVTALKIIVTCVLLSFLLPFLSYHILKYKVSVFDAGAIAASYGSVSAVTFIAASTMLKQNHIHYDAVMVSGIALMEFPAIVSGLIIIKLFFNKTQTSQSNSKVSVIIHEALTNSSVFLLIGTLIIGYLLGDFGRTQLKPFTEDIFKGMLCLYMLDMGIIAGSKLHFLRKSGLFLSLFAVIYPITIGMFVIFICKLMSLSTGNALLLTVLSASASYIAVPATMRYAVPKANMGLLLPMALGITFTFNVVIGIPLYNYIIHLVWAN
jgi:uncharacterized protein